MPSWPRERRVMGTAVPRLDGPAKVSGGAKYTYDQNPPELCHAAVRYCPVGRARVRRVDTARAEKLPGVRAIEVLAGAGRELRYHGDYLAVAVADSPDQARDAARAIEFELEPLPHAVTCEAAMAAGAPELLPQGNTRAADPRARGEVEAALARSEVVYEDEFRCHVVTHVCLEPHGAVAAWQGNQVTVWATTQAVSGVREGVARSLQLSPADVEVICEYMGGGFGSKLGMSLEETLAARLARRLGRPVKLMLDREMEHTYAGCRNSTVARIKLGAGRDGRLTACDVTSYGTGGIAGRAALPLPLIYNLPASRYQHTDVATSAGNVRAMRAPSHPLASFVMESALDGLADKLGLDPLRLRQVNLPAQALWQKQLESGAERIGWSERQPAGSQQGRYRRGYGVAVTQWGGGGHRSNARLAIHADGTVEIWCATQDIGTGTRTALAVVVAETLGLRPDQITVHIGRGSYPPSGGSGGSTTIGGISSAARTVSELALSKFYERVAGGLNCRAEDLEIQPGVVRQKTDGGRDLPWAAVCRLLGPDPITVEAERDPSLTTGGVNGVQFAAATVDVETGITRLEKIVAIQDCGLVVNKLTAESQVHGAVVMGIGFALFEERILDGGSGRMLNPNLEFYKLPGPSDIPEVEVIVQDVPGRGVIGIGEPPTIPTASAIANAVSNAIGARIPALPITPERVLTALAGREGSR